MLPDTKKCSTCQEVKPLDSFNRNACKKDGRANQCKECCRAYGAEYREKNKDRVVETKKLYREKNKDRIAEAKRIYHEKNKDRVAETKRLYRERNGEYHRKKDREIHHSRQESSKAMASKSGAYSPSEDQFIILNHKTMTDYQMAIALERTFSSIIGRKFRLREKGLL